MTEEKRDLVVVNAFDTIREYCDGRECEECALGDWCYSKNSNEGPPCGRELHPQDALDEERKLLYDALKEKAGSGHDAVEHPDHYTFGRYECIDVMADVYGEKAIMDYAKCNAFKYIWRADHKNGVEDLEKAVFYLNWIIEHEKG